MKSRRCPSGKVVYRDRIAAQVALLKASRSDSHRRQEQRIYHCTLCPWWHLTRQEKR